MPRIIHEFLWNEHSWIIHVEFVTLNKRILVTNIVQVVKKCYKIKIDSRDLRGRFLCFCCILHLSILHLRLLCIAKGVQLECKRSTVAMQKEYSCNANGVQLECKRSTVAMQMEYSWSAKGLHFKRKGGILRDEISLASTKNRIIH